MKGHTKRSAWYCSSCLACRANVYDQSSCIHHALIDIDQQSPNHWWNINNPSDAAKIHWAVLNGHRFRRSRESHVLFCSDVTKETDGLWLPTGKCTTHEHRENLRVKHGKVSAENDCDPIMKHLKHRCRDESEICENRKRLHSTAVIVAFVNSQKVVPSFWSHFGFRHQTTKVVDQISTWIHVYISSHFRSWLLVPKQQLNCSMSIYSQSQRNYSPQRFNSGVGVDPLEVFFLWLKCFWAECLLFAAITPPSWLRSESFLFWILQNSFVQVVIQVDPFLHTPCISALTMIRSGVKSLSILCWNCVFEGQAMFKTVLNMGQKETKFCMADQAENKFLPSV